MRHRLRLYFIRNMRGMDRFEIFMVTAVATILGVRLFLELTGYPQVGSSTLHIAHAVWGGLLMALTILILLIFLGKWTESVAALTGGVGFGLFIDEVGKFVTQSNDYFFQPSVAIMYVTFIALYLFVRYIFSSAGVIEVEYLVNAVKEMQDIPGGQLQESERQQIQFLLGKGDPDSPLVKSLQGVVAAAHIAAPAQPGFYQTWKSRLYHSYRRIAHSRWFTPAITVLFVAQFVGLLGAMITLMFDPGELTTQLDAFTFSDWAILGSNIVSGVLIGWGVILLRRNHLRAYVMFQRSVLVSIFVGQLFLFYKDEFGALSGLVFDLLLYLGLRFIIEREKEEAIEDAVQPEAKLHIGTQSNRMLKIPEREILAKDRQSK